MSHHQLRLLLVAPEAGARDLPARLARLRPEPLVTVTTADKAPPILKTTPVDAVLVCVGRGGLGLAEVEKLSRHTGRKPLLSVTFGSNDQVDLTNSGLCGKSTADIGASHLLPHFLSQLQTAAPSVSMEIDITAKALLGELVHAFDAAMAIVDDKHRIVEANSRFAERWGAKAASLTGRSLTERVPPIFLQNLDVALSEGRFECDDLYLKPLNGSPLGDPLHVIGASVRLSAGERVWLLSFDDGNAASARGQEPALPEAASAAIERLATEVRRRGGQLSAARVRFMGLGEVRAALGERWERLRAKVSMVSEAAIERHLSDEDVYVATGSGDYVLCFAATDAKAADSLASKIHKDIIARLFGEDIDDPHLAGEGLTPADRHDLRHVDVAIEQTSVPVELTTGTLEDAVVQRLDRARRLLDVEIGQHLAELRQALTLDSVPVRNRQGSSVPILRMSLPKSGSPQLQHIAIALGRRDDLALAIDTTIIEKVYAQFLSRVSPSHYRYLVDVHFGTLERRRPREAFFAMMSEVHDFAIGQLILNIVDLPQSFYLGRLNDALMHLKPCTLTQAVRLSAQQAATFDFKSLPCQLFTITARAAEEAREKGLAAKIRERLRQAHARLLVESGTGPASAKALDPDLLVQS